jgi:hypothetical protein
MTNNTPPALHPLIRSPLAALCALLILVGAALPASRASLMPPTLYNRLRWRFVGPYRGGWVTTVAGIPGRRNTYYIGTADGGIFVTHDSGRTWHPLFQHEPVSSMGAIAVAPSNPKILYAGTGQSGLRSDMSFGDGMYRSNNGGLTWKWIGLKKSQHIADISVDPHHPDRVLVAVLGHAFGPNRERGVFLTTNGGRSWHKTLYVNPNLGAIDLTRDPSQPNLVYAALWNFRFPFYGHYGVVNGPGSGLWRSEDGGRTWTRLPDIGLPKRNLGRIGLAIVPGSHGRVLDALVGAHHGGLFRSTDGGRRWTIVNRDPRLWGGDWYFGEVNTDPGHPKTLFVMNTALYESTDGGHHFVSIKGSPSGDDFHTLWIDPQNPRRMIVGADQGASISVDGGSTWTSWYNQPTAQIYHVATDNRFPFRIYGTQQDSGSIGIRSRGFRGFISNHSWYSTAGGEAGYVLPDPANPNIIYGSSIVGSISRDNLYTHESVNISPWPVPAYGVPPWRLRYRYPFNTALALSPRNPDVLYAGAQVIFRSSNQGQSWRVISPDLARTGRLAHPPRHAVPVTLRNATALGYGVVYTIDPSPIRKGEIWAGTTNGRVWITRNGGRTWSQVTPAGLPAWTRIENIAPSPFNPAVAYLAANRHRLDDLRPFLYVTHDFGHHWKSITRGIRTPAYLHVIRPDPVRRGLLYAGTETGFYISFDHGRHWQPFQENLPTVSVRDIAIHGNSLVIATHGRGFWMIDDLAPLREIQAGWVHRPLVLEHPAPAYRLRRTLYRDEPFPPETPHARNPATGVVIDYYLGRQPTAPLTLTIRTLGGGLIRRYTSTMHFPAPPPAPFPKLWIERQQPPTVRVGLNRFVWHLRATPPEAIRHGYQGPGLYHETPITPRGPIVPPGRYRLSVRIGTLRATTLFSVRADPRVHLGAAGYALQYRVARRLARDLTQDTQAFRSAERRIHALRAHGAPAATVAAAQRILHHLAVLNGEFGFLMGTIEGTDAVPTQPETREMHASEARLAKAQAALHRI